MRRYIALMAACGVLAISLGCQHVGGKCDCGYNASNYPILPPSNPHASAPILKPTPPPVPLPPSGNEE